MLSKKKKKSNWKKYRLLCCGYFVHFVFSFENQIKSGTLFFRDFEFFGKFFFQLHFFSIIFHVQTYKKKMFEMNKQAGKKLTKQRRKMIIYVKYVEWRIPVSGLIFFLILFVCDSRIGQPIYIVVFKAKKNLKTHNMVIWNYYFLFCFFEGKI